MVNLNCNGRTEFQYSGFAKLPTKWGVFNIHGFQFGDSHHLALTLGDLHAEDSVLLRIHSECLTGDALFSRRCDCGAQLESAFQLIAAESKGVILYLRQEGRGIGLVNKIRAYALQDCGLDTVDANLALGFSVDTREYLVCKSMLDHFKLMRFRLLTNNPLKVASMLEMGFEVTRVPTVFEITEDNKLYLLSKSSRLNHLVDI